MTRSLTFPATKLIPFLRAIADPDGTGGLRREQEDTLRRVEANLASGGDAPEQRVPGNRRLHRLWTAIPR